MSKFISVLVALFLPVLALNAGPKEGPVTSDREFFEALNLDFPGLEAVRADVAASDYSAACRDFVAYLKTRPATCIPSGKEKYNAANVEKYASNHLLSCSVWHQFGDVVDWSANPTPLKYNEWTWQLNRHPFWSELGKAYKATGNEKYARAFVSQMRSWVKANPLPTKAMNVPGSRWRTIEAGIRTRGSWPASFEYFLGSPSFEGESVMMMVKSFYEHGLYLRKFHRTNNWLTMEMNGLFHIALLFPEFKLSEEWAGYASSRLYEEQKIQFYPDGAQVELTTGYHGVSLKNILDLYKYAVVRGYKLPEDYVRRLEKAFEYYERICMPDGHFPALNDAGWGNCRSFMQEGFNCFPNRTDFQYIASNGKKGTEPEIKSDWMPWAGWYIMRNSFGKDGLYAHFEVGPFGAGHQHEDKLSFILYGYGRRLITECGTYAYDKSQWRKYVISARGHNVVRVDGNDQNRRALKAERRITHSDSPLSNRWISNQSFDFGEGWYTEGYGAKNDSTVTHYRALAFIKDRYWFLVDIMTPCDGKAHEYDTWFHFDSPSYSMLPKLHGVVSDEKDKSNIAVIPLRKDNRNCEVICGQNIPDVQGWLPKNGAKVYDCRPVATPTFHRKASGQVVEPYIFVPVRAGESLPVKKVKAVSMTEYEIIFTDGSRDRISFTINGNAIGQFSLKPSL